MKNIKYRNKLKLLGLSLLVMLLAACSTSITEPRSDLADDGRYDYSLSVEITADDNQLDIEHHYGGTAVVWRPEAGFAVLGLHADSASDFSLLNETNLNQDLIEAPEITANASGFDAWAGGFDAWAGGFDAWAGGFDAWGGGNTEPTTFGENLAIWDQINLPEAQAIASNLGAGVKIAVIDTGIDLNHPGFAGKLAPSSEWYDFVDYDALPQDEAGGSGYGHGTAVASVILQVAPEVTILPIRVLHADGAGDVTDVIAGIDHAIQMGADIINLSLGTTVDVTALHSIIEYAFDSKVFVVTSAGNADNESVTFPARRAASGPVSEYTVGVGSVTMSDIKSSFTNFGEDLELMAPGEQIYTLMPEGQIGYASGTSFAAPIVTGALALGLGEADDPKQFANEMSRTSVDINETNMDYFGDKRYDKKLGKGRLDIQAFLEKVL